MAVPRLLYHPGAARDLAEAIAWYMARSHQVAAAFHEEVERAVRLLLVAPTRWPTFDRRHRRVLVRNYPYSVVYRCVRKRVVIVAIAHGHRHPYYRNRR